MQITTNDLIIFKLSNDFTQISKIMDANIRYRKVRTHFRSWKVNKKSKNKSESCINR